MLLIQPKMAQGLDKFLALGSSMLNRVLQVALGVALAMACGVGIAQAGLQVQTVASGLEHPWAVAFLPGGRFLVTERPGRLRVIEPDGRVQVPLAGRG